MIFVYHLILSGFYILNESCLGVHIFSVSLYAMFIPSC